MEKPGLELKSGVPSATGFHHFGACPPPTAAPLPAPHPAVGSEPQPTSSLLSGLDSCASGFSRILPPPRVRNASTIRLQFSLLGAGGGQDSKVPHRGGHLRWPRGWILRTGLGEKMLERMRIARPGVPHSERRKVGGVVRKGRQVHWKSWVLCA